MAKTSAPGVPLRSLRGGALFFLWLALLTGCPESKDRGQARDAAATQSGSAAPSVGLRVPLPKGWTARVEPGEVLAIGPVGRDVMRIRRSSSDSMPSLKSLKKTFEENLVSVRATTVEEREEESFVLWRLQLASNSEGGPHWPAALAARKVNDAVYFCATEPGATDAEVKDAVAACENLGE